MRENIGLMLLILFLVPYVFLFFMEIKTFFKKEHLKTCKYISFKGIYSLSYWFIGIIPLAVVGPNFDTLPQDKISFAPIILIPILFIIDLVIVIIMKNDFKKLDPESDSYFYLKDWLGKKIPSILIIVIFISIAYLIDYLLIYMTLFGVIYG